MISLLDFFFPPVSLSGTHGLWVTDEERDMLAEAPIRLDALALSRRGMPSLDRLVAAAPYAGFPLLRTAVRRFKYHRVRALEVELGRLLFEASVFLSAPNDAVLCPVPLHWTREWSRGFNQSALLGVHLAARSGWPMRELLRRRRATGHQAHRAITERKGALSGAFSLRRRTGDIPACVILVDDICTSGTTLQECAAVLKEAGVQRVMGLVLALG